MGDFLDEKLTAPHTAFISVGRQIRIQYQIFTKTTKTTKHDNHAFRAGQGRALRDRDPRSRPPGQKRLQTWQGHFESRPLRLRDSGRDGPSGLPVHVELSYG